MNLPLGLSCYHTTFGGSGAMSPNAHGSSNKNFAPLERPLPKGVGAQNLIISKLAQYKIILSK